MRASVPCWGEGIITPLSPALLPKMTPLRTGKDIGRSCHRSSVSSSVLHIGQKAHRYTLLNHHGYLLIITGDLLP